MTKSNKRVTSADKITFVKKFKCTSKQKKNIRQRGKHDKTYDDSVTEGRSWQYTVWV